MASAETKRTSKTRVRAAALADETAVAQICLKTADSGEDATNLYSRADLPGLVWAVPYLHYDLSTCFVAEIDGKPVGYIVTCASTRNYEEWLRKSWQAEYEMRLKEFEAQTDTDRNALSAAHGHQKGAPSYADEYAAHLHINLLPEAQGSGLGRALIEAAEQELASRNVGGLHLGVSPNNLRAIGFYNALGFKKLENVDGYVMAKKLS